MISSGVLRKAESMSRFCAYQRDLHVASANFIASMFDCVTQPTDLPKPKFFPSTPESFKNSLASFISRTVYNAQLPTQVLLAALLYLTRLKARYPASKGASGNRLFLASLVIAQKFMVDGCYSNLTWVRVTRGFYGLEEVNRMERELLDFIGWDLHVEEASLFAVEELVMIHYLTPPGAQPTTSAPSMPSRSQSSNSLQSAAASNRVSRPPLTASTSMNMIALPDLVSRQPVYVPPSSSSAIPSPPVQPSEGRRQENKENQNLPLKPSRSRSPPVGPQARYQNRHRRFHDHPAAYHHLHSSIPAVSITKGGERTAPKILTKTTVAAPIVAEPHSLRAVLVKARPAVFVKPIVIGLSTTAVAATTSIPKSSVSPSSSINFSRPMRSQSSSSDLSCPSLEDNPSSVSSSSETSLIEAGQDELSVEKEGKKGKGVMFNLIRGWRGQAAP